MSFRNSLVGSLCILVSAFSFSASAGQQTTPWAHFKKIMIIVLENTDYDEALKQPFMSKLTQQGALFTNFNAESHPSQPNYIAMVSGSTQGVTGDGNVNLSVSHIGDLLEAKGLDWKVYAEDFPGNCFQGATQSRYARKHVPFISFKNVQTNPARCKKIVEAAALNTDIQNGTVPAFSLYVPNLDNDGHDTGAAYADSWLSKTFGPRLANPQFSKDMLLVVTFDENEGTAGNQIFTTLVGDSVAPGATSNTNLNHYSLIKLVEDEYGLGSLGKGDAQSTGITGIWK